MAHETVLAGHLGLTKLTMLQNVNSLLLSKAFLRCEGILQLNIPALCVKQLRSQIKRYV